jgi:hypothetical protein
MLLDVGTLLRVPAEIPAWHLPGMGKESVHAAFIRWWFEDELRLSVLLQNGVVVADGHRAVGIPIGGGSYAEDRKVHGKRHDGCAQEGDEGHHKNAAQSLSKVRLRPLSHDARL